MPKISAALLAYRHRDQGLEVLLVHPGGPFWAKKDEGAWSIPKGEIAPGEDPESAAQREFQEETGFLPAPPLISLGSAKQPGGKTILAWAVEQDFDLSRFRSNLFTMEWPPKSGRQREFPEVDRAEWFPIASGGPSCCRGRWCFSTPCKDSSAARRKTEASRGAEPHPLGRWLATGAAEGRPLRRSAVRHSQGGEADANALRTRSAAPMRSSTRRSSTSR